MLKAIINKSLSVTIVAALGLVAVAPTAAASGGEVYFTVRQLLADEFSGSERVSFVRVAPKSEVRAAIEKRLGRKLPHGEYTFYVARTGDHVDGYALFDEERGQHELISFGTFFDAQGKVTRVEVLAYREPYGDGIRAERFRRQFVGRGAVSGFRAEHDIDAVSGSTISSHAMCVGVQRASVLLDALVLARGAVLASAH